MHGIFNGLNLTFFAIMLIVFFISIRWLTKKQQSTFVKQAPTLLTSLGIFGTFFGIVLALLGFDGVDNIKEQINTIISGMQTAFITSVIGLFLSIILKICIIFLKTDKNNSDDIEAEKLIQSFVQQTENSSQSLEKLTLLLNAIGQDGDNSMIGQIRLLRSDFNDYQKHSQNFEQKLWQEMEKVTQTLAKSATETIIEALKNVISDFNKNLTEQFGENFKELNRAVFELVQWQNNYKQQIADMTKQYALGVQAIDATKDAIISIEESTEVIPDYMENLGAILKNNQNQLDELSKHLQSFADIRERAVDSLPKIQEHIKIVLDNMITGSQKIESSTQNFERSLQEFQDNFRTSLMNMSSEQKEIVRIQMRNLTENVEKSYNEIQKNINEILKETQENMGKAQNEAISSMGKSLVNITTKFADDYTILTEQMKRVIDQNRGFK